MSRRPCNVPSTWALLRFILCSKPSFSVTLSSKSSKMIMACIERVANSDRSFTVSTNWGTAAMLQRSGGSKWLFWAANTFKHQRKFTTWCHYNTQKTHKVFASETLDQSLTEVIFLPWSLRREHLSAVPVVVGTGRAILNLSLRQPFVDCSARPTWQGHFKRIGRLTQSSLIDPKPVFPAKLSTLLPIRLLSCIYHMAEEEPSSSSSSLSAVSASSFFVFLVFLGGLPSSPFFSFFTFFSALVFSSSASPSASVLRFLSGFAAFFFWSFSALSWVFSFQVLLHHPSLDPLSALLPVERKLNLPGKALPAPSLSTRAQGAWSEPLCHTGQNTLCELRGRPSGTLLVQETNQPQMWPNSCWSARRTTQWGQCRPRRQSLHPPNLL